MTLHMLVAVLAPLCGSSIPMGFNMGVLNTPQKVIRQWTNNSLQLQYNVHLSSNEEVIFWTAIVSSFLLCAMCSALNCSFIANRIGRKITFLLGHVLCLTASVLFSIGVYTNHIEIFIIGRFLSGMAGGIASTLVPLYYSEIFPKGKKGISTILHVFGMTLGIFISVTMGTDLVLGSKNTWQFLSGVPFFGSLLALLFHHCLLESPTFICSKLDDDDDESIFNILKKLRGSDDIINDEMVEIHSLRLKSELQKTENWDLKRVLQTPEYRLNLLTICVLFSTQQLSGINGCWFYTNTIFRMAGLNQLQSNVSLIIASLVNCSMCLIAFSFISNRFPRRRILISSIAGSTISLALLSTSLHLSTYYVVAPYIAMVTFVLFILSFTIALGQMPYVLVIELLPEGPRAVVMALGSFLLWSCNLLVSILLPLLNYSLGPLSLFLFVTISVIGGIYTYFLLPETFNKHDCKDKPNEKAVYVISKNKLTADIIM